MTEVPRVRVQAVDLGGEAAAALRDSRTSYELGIDFTAPPAKIAAALTDIFQEAVDTGRWARAGSGGHERCADHQTQPTRAAPHPESDHF